MNEIELTTQNVLLRNRAEKAERERDAVLIELQNLCEVVGKQSYTFTSRSVIEAHRQARRLLESLSPATESVAPLNATDEAEHPHLHRIQGTN